ncbi:PepSY domain-containing protein [Caulobacter sp. LARHSG274]
MDVAQVLRWLSWFHRWTGVGLCLLFLLWFASGAILLFVPFPSLSDQDRLTASERIDLAAVTIAPARALAVSGGGENLRLVSAAGRPLYLVKPDKGEVVAVDARTGQRAPPITAGQAKAIGVAFSRQAVEAVSSPLRYDQWVVHNRFDPWRPFYRLSLDDAAGTQLYVSSRTGEVLQRTDARGRAWNWAGAVPHWLYFTVLRQSFTAWDQTVWWVSLVGVATAAVGTFLGVYRTQKRLQGRKPDWSSFRGWLRWHHGLGLGVALFVLTWIVSGWLSMDHGRLFSRGAPAAQAEAAYHGRDLAAAFQAVPASALAALGPSSEISFNVVGGHPLAAAEGGGRPARVSLLDAPGRPILAALPPALLARAAGRAWPLASPVPLTAGPGDGLYRTAEGMAPRIVRFPLAAPKGASVYLDPVSGRVVIVMDASRRAYAWIYYALHTFNFPGLIDHPVLRKVLVLIPLLAGLVFSFTGLVIAIKRLRIAAA